MKKFLCACAAVVALLTGCIDDPASHPAAVSANDTSVEVYLQLPEMETPGSRSTDDTAVTDVNLFLFDRNGHPTARTYTTSVSPLRFSCPAGRYRLYVLANLHEELAPLSESELCGFRIFDVESFGTLPMAGMTEVEIPAADKVSLPPVEVRRIVARIEYDIRIDEAMQGKIELEQVRSVDLPEYAAPFSNGCPESFFSKETFEVNATGHSGSFYMFPNPQGRVPEIVGQTQRSPRAAPQHATHLLILARYNSIRAVNYFVYLGENDTDSFDVRANTIQRINITIKGIEAVDTRVDTYFPVNSCQPERIGDYCIPGTYQGYVMRLFGKNDAAITARYEQAAGEALDFAFLDTQGHEVSLLRSRRTNYRLTYEPPVITAVNAHTRHRIIITDESKHETIFDVPLEWANCLQVFCSGGTVESEDALAEDRQSAHVRFACREGCRLCARPADGYVFTGWYDVENAALLSTKAEYTYHAERTPQTLEARFRMRQASARTETDTADSTCDRACTLVRPDSCKE
ncbi:MAG: hypothetical protein NC226_05745 [Bacteroides cellulosilyticus]|nr:hypothetical protein [Bacteroides cellulosilyticus]